MSCTVVVLSDDDLICVSDTFNKWFQRKLYCQKFFSINMVFHFFKAKCPPEVNIVTNSSPPKLLASDEILITGLLFVILSLEQNFFFFTPPLNINY